MVTFFYLIFSRKNIISFRKLRQGYRPYFALLHFIIFLLVFLLKQFLDCVLILRKAEAEAKVVEPAAGIVVETKRHSAAPRVVVPATATAHAVGARRWSRWIRLRASAVTSIPVLTPFINITAHIVNTQFVRRFGFYVVCSTTAVVIVPRNISYCVAATVFVTSRFIASSCCIFPFRFRRKSEIPAC